MEFVETGVEGLDELLGGGIRRTSTVLLTGGPGTGKSLLALQYLYTGVREADERGIYLSFEENEADVRRAAESIGFDRWGEYVDAGDIVVYDKRDLLLEQDLSETMSFLLTEMELNTFDRLVVDSLTMFGMFFETEREKRTYLLKFTDLLKEHELTSVFTTEQNGSLPNVEPELEHFLTDGNIYLLQTPTEEGGNRHVWVSKMRKQDINTDVFPMEIDEGGLTVHTQWTGTSILKDGNADSFPS